MNVLDRSMATALSALRRVAGLEVIDRLGWRKGLERAVYTVMRDGTRAAGAAGRTFAKATSLARPARQRPTAAPDLFDLTPTEEQQMLQAAFRDVARDVLRPAALKADEACEAPHEVIEQANQLGATMLAVPTELGGVAEERSTVTTVLAAEALATGDLGLAAACLAPAAVATAVGLWGDADQQATYLPPFVGDDPPTAAFAVMEPRPVFDPFELATTARRDGGDLVLDGVKAMVPRAGQAELFLVAADLDGTGPALVLVESSADGLTVAPDPGMGVRAAATGRLHLEGVRVPASALLADADPAVYAEAVRRARLGWSALALGAAQAVLDYVIPYVNERHAFGEPISHRQSVAFTVSDIAIELEGARLATYRAAALADRGRPFDGPAAAARTLVGRTGMQIGSDGVQLLGGHGYVKEHPVERWYRDLRAAGLMEGALLV